MAARTIASLGEAVQSVALLWVATTNVENPGLALGLAGLAITAPNVLVGPLLGPLADRFNRRGVLLTADALSAALTLLIPVAHAAAGMPGAAVLAFVVWSLRMLAASAFAASLPDLVGNDGLVRANGLATSLTQAGFAAGAAIGGLLAAVALEGAFAGSALALGTSALVLSRISPRPFVRTLSDPDTTEAYWRSIRSGLEFANHSSPVKMVLAVGTLATVGFAPAVIAIPALVSQELGGGAADYGVIVTITSVGLVSGGLAVSRFGSTVRRPLLLAIGLIAMAAMTMILAAAASIFMAGLAVLMRAAANSVVSVATVSLAQQHVPTELRGRVMAFRVAVQEVPRLFILPVAGALVDLLGSRLTIMGMAAVIGVAGAVAIAGGRVLSRSPN